MNRCDVVIIGGGPAGLSAALLLGRCLRRVVLFDSGEYRNAATRAVHGFLTRDGADPAELRRIAREQLVPYDTVAIHDTPVLDARRVGDGFHVVPRDAPALSCRKLIVATGLADELPPIAGTGGLYGKCIFHCPYCDGWELRGEPLAVYGRGDHHGGELAVVLKLWSDDVILCADGPAGLSRACGRRLERHRIPVREEKVLRFEASGPGLRVVLDGGAIERRALFFSIGVRQRSDLPAKLGCRFDKDDGVRTWGGATSVPGLYVIGDASRDVLQAIVGAGEGAEAAVRINKELIREDLM